MSRSLEKEIPYSTVYLERLNLRAYIMGTVLILFGIVNLLLMVLKPEIDQLLLLFFYSIPSNTAISPFPHEPVIVLTGQTNNIFLVCLAATLGTMVAGCIDHQFFTPLLNLQYSLKYKQTRFYKWTMKYFLVSPFWIIVLFALTPLPFYIVKFLAFSIRYPLSSFLCAYAVGRVPRYLILAWMGYALDIPKNLLVGIFLVIFAIYIVSTVLSRIRSIRRKNGER